MTDQRRRTDPPSARSHFRSNRLLEDSGRWYFSTREGTLEGPFEDRISAQKALAAYAAIMRLELIEPTSALSLTENA